MRRLACLAAVLVLGLGAGAASGAGTHAAVLDRTAKSCSAGYVRASLSWGVKCLRAGEFCVVGSAEYHRYGYTCPVSGHLTYYRAR